jgi:hypothetical protein
MLIDCDECVMQHTSACDDCVASVLLAGNPFRRVELDERETEAIENLAEAGLVPQLRLVKKAANE